MVQLFDYHFDSGNLDYLKKHVLIRVGWFRLGYMSSVPNEVSGFNFDKGCNTNDKTSLSFKLVSMRFVRDNWNL